MLKIKKSLLFLSLFVLNSFHNCVSSELKYIKETLTLGDLIVVSSSSGKQLYSFSPHQKTYLKAPYPDQLETMKSLWHKESLMLEDVDHDLLHRTESSAINNYFEKVQEIEQRINMFLKTLPLDQNIRGSSLDIFNMYYEKEIKAPINKSFSEIISLHKALVKMKKNNKQLIDTLLFREDMNLPPEPIEEDENEDKERLKHERAVLKKYKDRISKEEYDREYKNMSEEYTRTYKAKNKERYAALRKKFREYHTSFITKKSSGIQIQHKELLLYQDKIDPQKFKEILNFYNKFEKDYKTANDLAIKYNKVTDILPLSDSDDPLTVIETLQDNLINAGSTFVTKAKEEIERIKKEELKAKQEAADKKSKLRGDAPAFNPSAVPFNPSAVPFVPSAVPFVPDSK